MSTNTTKGGVMTANKQLVSVRIAHDLVAKMRTLTQYTGQTQTQIVEEALRQYMALCMPMDAAAAPIGGAPAIDDDEPDEIDDDITDDDIDRHHQPRQRGLWGTVARGGKGY